MSAAAPWTRAVAVQAATEARLTLRRGESLLAMVGIPIVAVLIVGALAGSAIDRRGILASTMALAIVASGLVNLGIATAFERGYGVLKRLGGSPLGRSGLVAAKLSVVVVIAATQVVGLLAVTMIIGWPAAADISGPALAITTVGGAITFAGIGLAIAGQLRPEATLVVANVLFLLALLFGGPVGELLAYPDAVATAVRILPSGALADGLAAALGAPGADLTGALVVLAAWALVATAVATRTFRWE